MSRPSLPVDEVLPQLVAALRDHPSAVLLAPTGAGKTTRVPGALADAGFGRVLMLEPRRIAARAAARRIASERGARLGHEVGYHVRFDKKLRDDTAISVLTEGLLVRRLQSDPFLEGVDVVVFDEFHERHLATDLSLAMCRRVQTDARDDLKLVVMSATLDPEPIARWLGGVPVVRSEGRSFPVEVRWHEREDDRKLGLQVRSAVREALEQTDGDVLVFLPGMREIRWCQQSLSDLARPGQLEVLRLHGSDSRDNQDRALSGSGPRKVVLSTNVAESSVTLPRVTAVIDSGLARVPRYDLRTGIDRLGVESISAASADQRSGRAGRTAPGIAWRLWTRNQQARLAAADVPELRRVDLAGTVLQLRTWGESDLAAFPWFEAPDSSALAVAEEELAQLGADGELGARLARLPLHPRLGVLLLTAAELGQASAGARTAAILSEGLRRPGVRGWALVDALRESDPGIERVAKQLERLLPRGGGAGVSAPQALGRAAVAAWPDRVSRRRSPDAADAVTAAGRGLSLWAADALAGFELFVALDIQGVDGSEDVVRLAVGIDEEWLPARGFEQVVAPVWDAANHRVLGVSRRQWCGLVLDERSAKVPAQAAAELLAQRAKADRDRALALDNPDVAGLLNRARFLARTMPDLGMPDFQDAVLDQVIDELAHGRRSFADLRKAPLLGALKNRLTWPQRQLLDQHAPERIEVPSGSNIRLEYRPEGAPVLAVRMQELFGLTDTPTIAGGRAKVLLHLLAPNRRPQQVTDDLAGFWANVWPQVRKELRGRYPKHAWPEDPVAARALRGTKRRG